MKNKLLSMLSVITEEEKIILSDPTGLNLNNYGIGKDNRIDAASLLQSGKLISIRPHTRFVHFPAHTHNYIEMVYMYSGSTTHIINGTEIILKTGELLLLGPDALQEIYPAEQNDIAINFIILPEFFERALEVFGEEENRIVEFLVGCLFSKKGQVGYLHFDVADVLPIQNLLENLIWTVMFDEPNRRSIRQHTAGLLLLLLANHTERINTKESDTTLFYTSVLKYIEENYKDASLTKLAEIMNVSAGTLSKQITRRFGCTFTMLLKERRFRKAVSLLKDTALPINDIITIVGYENTSYFFRTFRLKYGMSPNKYRSMTGLEPVTPAKQNF